VTPKLEITSVRTVEIEHRFSPLVRASE